MSDTNIATIRTTVPATWAALLVWACNKGFGWELNVDELLPYLPVFTAVAAIFYRLGRLIEAKVPWLGYVLFGSAKTPSY